MKNYNHYFATFLVLLSFGMQIINAQAIHEQENKIDKFMNSVSQTDNESVLALLDVISYGEKLDNELSSTNDLVLEFKKLRSITKADLEEDLRIEEWMIDVNDDLWAADAEEAEEMESWMFEPGDWLAVSGNVSNKFVSKSCSNR